MLGRLSDLLKTKGRDAAKPGSGSVPPPYTIDGPAVRYVVRNMSDVLSAIQNEINEGPTSESALTNEGKKRTGGLSSELGFRLLLGFGRGIASAHTHFAIPGISNEVAIRVSPPDVNVAMVTENTSNEIAKKFLGEGVRLDAYEDVTITVLVDLRTNELLPVIDRITKMKYYYAAVALDDLSPEQIEELENETMKLMIQLNYRPQQYDPMMNNKFNEFIDDNVRHARTSMDNRFTRPGGSLLFAPRFAVGVDDETVAKQLRQMGDLVGTPEIGIARTKNGQLHWVIDMSEGSSSGGHILRRLYVPYSKLTFNQRLEAVLAGHLGLAMPSSRAEIESALLALMQMHSGSLERLTLGDGLTMWKLPREIEAVRPNLIGTMLGEKGKASYHESEEYLNYVFSHLGEVKNALSTGPDGG